jgi:hypothetical protein
MRTKVIIEGFKNTQKFRVVLNGIIIGDCQVKDLIGSRFQQREQRNAVWEALIQLSFTRRTCNPNTKGFGANLRGYDVQVDLV